LEQKHKLITAKIKAGKAWFGIFDKNVLAVSKWSLASVATSNMASSNLLTDPDRNISSWEISYYIK